MGNAELWRVREKNESFFNFWLGANPHGYGLVLKDAKLKAAKRWCFPEGCQDRVLQIVQNIVFLLKDAKMHAHGLWP